MPWMRQNILQTKSIGATHARSHRWLLKSLSVYLLCSVVGFAYFSRLYLLKHLPNSCVNFFLLSKQIMSKDSMLVFDVLINIRLWQCFHFGRRNAKLRQSSSNCPCLMYLVLHTLWREFYIYFKVYCGIWKWQISANII